jgi:hypothetical protein
VVADEIDLHAPVALQWSVGIVVNKSLTAHLL